MGQDRPLAWLDLYWLPLGAGGRFVRWNGRVYERCLAWRQHRKALDLYHAALELHLDGTTYAIEMGPVWNVTAADKVVTCQGPVGMRWLGRFRAFQYEVRCWPNGTIPDLAEAVGGPQRVSEEAHQVAGVLALLHGVPPLTWGRDELRTGDMWSSNSLVSWALARSGHDMQTVHAPAYGRAPGWDAGLALAARQGTAGTSAQTRSPSQGSSA